MTQQEFDAAYFAAQPPQLRKVVSATDAVNLAAAGFKVDVPIHVWGWSPYLTMWMRQQYGYTWVPSALMPNIKVPPGIHMPNQPDYDPDHPPAGSIKVSLDLADYPPFDPPAPPPQPSSGSGTPADPVMGETSPGSDCFIVAPFFAGKNGDIVEDSRGKFQLVAVTTPFGVSRYFKKVG